MQFLTVIVHIILKYCLSHVKTIALAVEMTS